MRAADMIFEKPHFVPKKRSRHKEPCCAARKLFSVARSRQDAIPPDLNSLATTFYPACPNAVAFYYALPDIEPAYLQMT